MILLKAYTKVVLIGGGSSDNELSTNEFGKERELINEYGKLNYCVSFAESFNVEVSFDCSSVILHLI